jgi:DNA mismatch repair protein MutS2
MAELDLSDIDLLNPRGAPRLDASGLRLALTFAFAQGQVGDAFERVLEAAALPESDWDPQCFANDLFVDVFRTRCLRISVEGQQYSPGAKWMSRLLTAPPTEYETVEFRQEIFGELCQRPDLLEALGDVYRKCRHLRDLLSRSGGAAQSEPDQRRLDVLRITHRIGRALGAFEGASSGLSRLSHLAKSFDDSPAFVRAGQLVHFESQSAQVSARVTLGFDGQIRSCELIDAWHNPDHPAQLSPFARFVERLRLLFGGYRTSPLEILRHCMIELFEQLLPQVTALLQLIGDLEFYLAGMWFRDSLLRAGYPVCLPRFHVGRRRSIWQLSNPLLIAEGVAVKPCDLHTHEDKRITLITGPNSGGKTRLLQALSLCQLLGQVGLFVPARDALLPWTPGLFVSLIEQTAADQAEGRLGTELLRIRHLFSAAKPGSLIVLDELCSGTNPREGEEIFRMVLRLLGELQPDAFITTHFLDFAERLERGDDALGFLQVELDAAERPTYSFVPGVAKTSLAHKLAERLGVTEPQLLGLMRENGVQPSSAPVAVELAAPKRLAI